jgi:hypothetical protein
MILPLISDGNFALSELGDLVDVILGIVYFLSLRLLRFVILMILIIVCSRAVLIRYAHIHVTGMFARTGSIPGLTTSPALAVAGGCSIHEPQGFVIDVWIGVGRKGPDFADVLVHGVCLNRIPFVEWL